ncbi:U6 snRNA-associated Sm LSm2 [Micractinium conductrix]|uniref:U6 snRNA-associated Sm LSm2 n=1 Tax=Micractinium conductrix TaxID=554055 RepID=A0A2P6V2M6_9CHLO|nr:U6 snRNA-associated Sm LSm2 [Micractinium conductrix]|eukprot:PSC68346.1 U6 snRNA-associated Sm LSm2 [Micractinium conductrix]
MLFYSYFKTLVGKEITVELKNDLAITGTLHSVDQYLNIKLNNIRVVNEQKYPHMLSVRACFVRGSVVRALSCYIVRKRERVRKGVRGA